MKMNWLAGTVLRDPADVRAFLLAAGTGRPSLHPYVGSEDRWLRWNGWNDTVAVGTDGTGRPVVVTMHHYAAGHDGMTAGFAGDTPRGGNDDFVFEPLTFPLVLLRAVPVVNYPGHTPTPVPA